MSKLAFFGTPDFAATIFEGLIAYCKKNGHTIGFAVCQPDRPKGRNHKIEMPKVKAVALVHGIEVFQPETLKSGTQDGDSFFHILESASLDLAIVVAYGRIIPRRMLVMPRRGFVNVHASLLPRWRGASPIQRALQAGDTTTGVSIMDLVPEMDAGDIYKMQSIPIAVEDTAATLTPKLADLGLQTLLASLEGILNGELRKTPQATQGLTFAPKLLKDDGLIDWERPASDLINHARAMEPWPQSSTYLKGVAVKLFGAYKPTTQIMNDATPAGTIISIDEILLVKCSDQVVAFSEIQFEGKRRMSVRDVVNGNLLHVGDHFSTQRLAI